MKPTQKTQSIAVNSAVKYKNSTMNTLHNIKLTSSNLKTETEKILSLSKNFKATQDPKLKIAKIHLSRTNIIDNQNTNESSNDLKNKNE